MLIHSLRSYIASIKFTSLNFHIVLALVLCWGFLGTAAGAANTAGTPSQIFIVSGNNQAGTVGTTLPNPFVVKVEDSKGNVVAGAKVVWTITAGGASFPTGSTTTNSSGVASNTMTLGTVTAWDSARATIVSGGNVNVGANAKAGTAVTIGLYGGNAQTEIVGSTLPQDLEVLCRDKYGNTSGPTQIDWNVTAGGGSVPYYESPTVTGVAVKSMTLGKVPGVNTITATIAGTTATYTFTETSFAGPPSAMSIAGGNAQDGEPGVPLPKPLKILVTDLYGNPLDGILTNWTATTAGDELAQQSVYTAVSGHSSNDLTMGPAYGKHFVTVTVNGTSIQQTLTEIHGFAVTVQETPAPNPKAMEPYFLGFSYPRTWVSVPMFDANNTTVVTLFKKLGPGVIRFSGEEEEAASKVTWSPSGRGLVYGTVSTPDIVRLAAFAKATNWKVLYGIALFDNTPAAAASEAAVVSKQLGSSLLGFEIGNEPDIYDAPHYGDPKVPQIPGYTWQDYISPTTLYSNGDPMPSWVVFANAIQAAVPNAPLTGPTGGYDWAIPRAQDTEAPPLSLLTMHYYAEWANEPATLTRLLSADPRIAVWFPGLNQAAQAANIPGGYRITETNSVSVYLIPGLTDSFGATLWTIDLLFNNALNGSSGVNMTSGGNGPGSYSPLQDNLKTVTGLASTYYGLFAYSLLQKGGTLMKTQNSPGYYTTLSTYAVQQPDGSTDVIVSNKDPVNTITVALAPAGSLSQATSLLLTAPSLTSTSGFTLGGSPINLDGTWTPTSNPSVPIDGGAAVITVPPGSAQLVHMQ